MSILPLNNLIQKFPDLLDNKRVKQIQDFAYSIDFKENPSFVFNRETQENTVNPDVRKSKTYTTKDSNLLNFIEEFILSKMNSISKDFAYRLARDYVTFICYEDGDFFDWHVDFEKVRINHGENGFKEMHFIYCVQGCSLGGDLLIKDSNNNIITIKEAKTTNSAVVFDKLMEHMGDKVISGKKIIMTIDLYVISNIRLETNISQNLESEISDFLTGKNSIGNKKDYISMKGNYDAFKTVWKTLENKKCFTPFLEMKANIGDNAFHIFANSNGIIYINLTRIDDDDDYKKVMYEYLEDKWFYSKTEENLKMEKRFKLEDYKEIESKKDNESYAERYRYSLRHDLYKTFDENANPAELFIRLITDLSSSEDIYDLDNLPVPEWSFNYNTNVSNKLPTFFLDKEFQDWNWETVNSGYSYHCNEPSYEHFDVNYRYGIMRIDTESFNLNLDNVPWENGKKHRKHKRHSKNEQSITTEDSHFSTTSDTSSYESCSE